MILLFSEQHKRRSARIRKGKGVKRARTYPEIKLTMIADSVYYESGEKIKCRRGSASIREDVKNNL